MNVAYIFILIWIFIIIRVTIYTFKKADKCNRITDNILLSILFNVLVSVFYCFLSFYLWFLISNKKEEHSGKYIPIVSLERGSNIEGHFILGSGSIKEEDYYYMYNDLGNNTFKLIKFPCNEYTIKETDEVPPGIRKLKVTRTFGILYLIEEENEKIINVPKGTIIKEFKP